MQEHTGFSGASRTIIIFAAFVVVVAGIKTAESLMVTFLLSGFFAIICAPPFMFMLRKGVPDWASLIIVVIGITAIQFLFITIIASSIADFSRDIPLYQERLQQLFVSFTTTLDSWGVAVPESALQQHFDPGVILKMAANTLGSLGSVLSNSFMIILTVIFMLFEGASLPKKLQVAFGNDSQHMAHLSRFLDDVKSYMTIKSVISLITGFAIYIWLLIVGVDYALLWGVVAFLFNFVPNIGSIIAAIPAVLLALIQLGPLSAIFAGVGFLLANIIMGNVVEPRFMGRGLGLSTLVVFLSLVFWGWVMGPVGMLLSVPLTMLMKIAFESSEETKWIAIIMGPDIRDSSPE
ncbi:AI-2E family transporter [Alkalimarinus sediminis]|uniref:AI-2E family transporter n=1 Tax=Alkalimarinus sediminis TaxID=1632866 RepID=A0A9E8HG01_9ALTE|nr:AI-2E family transporter [Alkalimarinus sediminis]UZW73948.1 AI-2E family transporter [Alkalimarinus sediminis]